MAGSPLNVYLNEDQKCIWDRKFQSGFWRITLALSYTEHGWVNETGGKRKGESLGDHKFLMAQLFDLPDTELLQVFFPPLAAIRIFELKLCLDCQIVTLLYHYVKSLSGFQTGVTLFFPYNVGHTRICITIGESHGLSGWEKPIVAHLNPPNIQVCFQV